MRPPRHLPPLSLSPFLQRRPLLQNQNAGAEGAVTITDTSKIKEKSDKRDGRGRRNGVCGMLMPVEYFSALPHLELLNVRYQFGLVKSTSCQSDKFANL